MKKTMSFGKFSNQSKHYYLTKNGFLGKGFSIYSLETKELYRGNSESEFQDIKLNYLKNYTFLPLGNNFDNDGFTALVINQNIPLPKIEIKNFNCYTILIFDSDQNTMNALERIPLENIIDLSKYFDLETTFLNFFFSKDFLHTELQNCHYISDIVKKLDSNLYAAFQLAYSGILNL